jgi:hypothetical protein
MGVKSALVPVEDEFLQGTFLFQKAKEFDGLHLL